MIKSSSPVSSEDIKKDVTIQEILLQVVKVMLINVVIFRKLLICLTAQLYINQEQRTQGIYIFYTRLQFNEETYT